MAMLHTVNKSPFERNSLASCLRLAKGGCSVLLIEDGVYGAIQGTEKSDMVSSAMEDVKFYVLGPDLNARGIGGGKIIDGINVVDYDGFVALVAEHDVTQAWL